MMTNLPSNTKNIRVRTQSKSNSKEKHKLFLKTQPQSTNMATNHQTQHISHSNLSTTIFNLQIAKLSQKQRMASNSFLNKQKKSLVISNKQNASSKIVKNKNLEKDENYQKNLVPPKKLTIIQLLQEKPLKELDDEEMQTSREKNYKNAVKKINQNKIQTEFFYQKHFSNVQFEKGFLNYKKQCQKMLILKDFSNFQISNQFSIVLNDQFQKVNCSTQTVYFQNSEKQLSQYAKYRQLKLKSLNGFQDQKIKINKILSTTKDLQENHERFMESIMSGPENQRQKRVLDLSKDISNHAFNINEAFKRINELVENFEQITEKKIYYIATKKSELMTSIQHLIESSLFLQMNKNNFKDEKMIRILQRVKNQTNYLHRFSKKNENYGALFLKHYNSEIENLQNEYELFSKSCLENRVLLYNCVKKIQKVPVLIASLFGLDKEPEVGEGLTCQSFIQGRIKEYMNAKCQDCCHTKTKIRVIQFHSAKLKPVFKSIQWLLEDKSKPAGCLSIL